MKITIEIKSGQHGDIVTKGDIQRNIDAVENGLSEQLIVPEDIFLLRDTISILEEIQRQLPDKEECNE